MNLDEYETPLTDKVYGESRFSDNDYILRLFEMRDHARDLERKLALCRDALNACHIALPDGDDTAWKALAATEPKQ